MLRTKNHRPRLTTDLITRSNLIDELNQKIPKPLTIVSAPAEYGNGMLINQWIEHNNFRHARVLLAEDSNGLRAFLIYLVESILTILRDIKQMRAFSRVNENHISDLLFDEKETKKLVEKRTKNFFSKMTYKKNFNERKVEF